MQFFRVFFICLAVAFIAPSFSWARGALCINTDNATLRSKPDKNDPSFKKVLQNTPLETTGKSKRNWIQVKDFSGRVSWVHRRDVSYAQKCVVVRVNKSRMRQGPGEESFPKAALAKKGDPFVDLGEGEDGWLRVQNSSGEKSWISLEHVWRPTSVRLRMSFDKE